MILTNEKDALVVSSFIFIIGLIIGSFLNVLIYRLPLNISLINPKRSVCTNCNTTIKWYENIPILSYIILQGKCSNCNTHISITYPIVEFLTATITLFLYHKIGLNFNFFISLIIFYLLIILSFIDFKYKAVPDYLLILVLLLSIFMDYFSLQNALKFAGAFILLEIFITFYIQNIKYKITQDETLLHQKALGEGDIPIVAVIGGILGVQLGIIAIFLSAILAIIPSLINHFIKKDIETPFIPYLSLALLIVYMFDNDIKNWLLG